MPEYRRARIAGGTYFFTVNTLHRLPVLLNDDVRVALRRGIEKARETHPFLIGAWVLLPDHLHCIWTLPAGDADFAVRWAIIKRQVGKTCAARYVEPDAFNASRARRRESGLWQRRYWEHLIRDEDDYRRHVDYIHWNPVKHGYVKKASEWPYSTFYRYVKAGVYDLEWELPDKQFDDDKYVQWEACMVHAMHPTTAGRNGAETIDGDNNRC